MKNVGTTKCREHVELDFKTHKVHVLRLVQVGRVKGIYEKMPIEFLPKVETILL